MDREIETAPEAPVPGPGAESAPAPAAAPAPEAGFGLYVHWPFCLAKCPYCDFNSHVREAIDQVRWRRALVRELDHFAGLVPGRQVTSLFFGGGTPSLMAAETAAAVIEAAEARWGLAADAEITLEANPTSAEAARFRDYRAAGVNRLSLGVQALDDAALGALGREHDRAAALRALEAATAVFPRVSLDLIYARPGQTVAAWRAELGEALAMGTAHLSAYQLTIEEGTPFHAAHRRGELVPPGEGRAAALYEATQEMCAAAGLHAYEISNHARPGAECRHNLLYWLGGEYAGIGPGAHGRLDLARGAGRRRTAIRTARTPEAWLAEVESRGHATREAAPLDEAERLAELLMMGLRLRAGVPRAGFRAALGREIEEVLPADRLARLAAGGFIVLDDEGLRATPAGRRRLDAVLAALLA